MALTRLGTHEGALVWLLLLGGRDFDLLLRDGCVAAGLALSV